MCVVFIYLPSEGANPHCLSLSLFYSLSRTHTRTHTHSPVLRSSPGAALCSSCCKFVYVCPVFFFFFLTIPPRPSPLSLIFFLLHSFFRLSCETEVRVHRLEDRERKHKEDKANKQENTGRRSFVISISSPIATHFCLFSYLVWVFR